MDWRKTQSWQELKHVNRYNDIIKKNLIQSPIPRHQSLEQWRNPVANTDSSSLCVIFTLCLSHHCQSLREWHGCVHTVVSGCTLTVPLPPHTLLQIKPVIIAGVLQPPKISVTQLSAPLCSAAGQDQGYSLLPRDTMHSLTLKERELGAAACVCVCVLVFMSRPPFDMVCVLLSDYIPDKWCAWGTRVSHQGGENRKLDGLDGYNFCNFDCAAGTSAPQGSLSDSNVKFPDFSTTFPD